MGSDQEAWRLNGKKLTLSAAAAFYFVRHQDMDAEGDAQVQRGGERPNTAAKLGRAA